MVVRKKGSNVGDFNFMIGALDKRTHSTVLYRKNLKFPELEEAFKELKKKYK